MVRQAPQIFIVRNCLKWRRANNAKTGGKSTAGKKEHHMKKP